MDIINKNAEMLDDNKPEQIQYIKAIPDELHNSINKFIATRGHT